MAVGCDDYRIDLWDPAIRGGRWPGWRGTKIGGSVSPSARGRCPDLHRWDNTTRLWDSERGRPLLRECAGNFLALSARAVAWPCDGAIGSRSGSWSWGGSVVRCPTRPQASISAPMASCSPRGAGTPVCWDQPRPRGGPASCRALVVAMFQPAGDALVTLGQETGLLSWPTGAAHGGSCDASRLGPPDPQTASERRRGQACWSADGRLLAVVDGPKGEVCDPGWESGAERARLRPDPASPPRSRRSQGPDAADRGPLCDRLGLSPRVRLALSPRVGGPRPATIRSLPLSHRRSSRSGKRPVAGRAPCRGSLPGDHVAFSPDGRWLVVGGVSDYRFYRVGTWQAGPIVPRDSGGSTPGPLAFAPGTAACSPSPPRLTEVQLVDPTTGRALATLQAPGRDRSRGSASAGRPPPGGGHHGGPRPALGPG